MTCILDSCHNVAPCNIFSETIVRKLLGQKESYTLQRLRAEGTLYEEFVVKVGVHQESELSPLLFIMVLKHGSCILDTIQEKNL